MATNIEIVNAAVTLIAKAAILAARFSGRARKRSLKRLASMDIDDRQGDHLSSRQGLSAANTDYHPSTRGSKETDKQAVYASRKTIHSLLHGNLSGSKTQSHRISGHR